ncbi:hypothetical protein ACLB1Q_07240 [Escherichia coli]
MLGVVIVVSITILHDVVRGGGGWLPTVVSPYLCPGILTPTVKRALTAFNRFYRRTEDKYQQDVISVLAVSERYGALSGTGW